MESKTLQKKLESKLRRLIKKYNLNVKSPYSDSYYNIEVDWGYKPEGSLRLSDHWNFESCDSIHCELADTDKYTERWLLCEYHEGKYHIVEELFTPEEEEMEKRCHRRAQNKRIKLFKEMYMKGA